MKREQALCRDSACRTPSLAKPEPSELQYESWCERDVGDVELLYGNPRAPAYIGRIYQLIPQTIPQTSYTDRESNIYCTLFALLRYYQMAKVAPQGSGRRRYVTVAME